MLESLRVFLQLGSSLFKSGGAELLLNLLPSVLLLLKYPEKIKNIFYWIMVFLFTKVVIKWSTLGLFLILLEWEIVMRMNRL